MWSHTPVVISSDVVKEDHGAPLRRVYDILFTPWRHGIAGPWLAEESVAGDWTSGFIGGKNWPGHERMCRVSGDRCKYIQLLCDTYILKSREIFFFLQNTI